MNFEEVHKKYFDPSEDEDSLASTTSDISFTMTKKETLVETKTKEADNISELVKTMEKHEDIKLDDSLIDKANEIYSYMKDSSESSNQINSEKDQDDRSLDLSLNESEIKKVADSLENTQMDESSNNIENQLEFTEVVKNLEAAMNESFGDENLGNSNSDLNEIQSEQVNIEAQAQVNEDNLTADLVDPLKSFGNQNLSKIADEVIQSENKPDSAHEPVESNIDQIEDKNSDQQIQEINQTEPEIREPLNAKSGEELNIPIETIEPKQSEESNDTLSQIMQFVTGLTALGSFGEKSPESQEQNNEQFTDLVNEIQNNLNSRVLETEVTESTADTVDDSQKSNQINESINEESQQSLAEDNQQSELDASQISNIDEEVKQSDSEEIVKVEALQSRSEPEKQEPSQQVEQEQPSEPSQDIEISISEKIASLAHQLAGEPELSEKNDPSGEIRIISDDGIEAIGCTLFSPDEILLRKDEVLNKYKISNEQFDLCREFFNERKDGSLLNNSILRVLMREALKKRPQVKAEEIDIDRALVAVDGDQDDKVTFDEFIQYLLLFFSSKSNVENRIGNILKAKLSSETLSANEAVQFASFLNLFYGQKTDSEQFKEDLNLSDFLKDILPNLGSLAFVHPVEETNELSTDQQENEQETDKAQEQESIEQSNKGEDQLIEA